MCRGDGSSVCFIWIQSKPCSTSVDVHEGGMSQEDDSYLDCAGSYRARWSIDCTGAAR